MMRRGGREFFFFFVFFFSLNSPTPGTLLFSKSDGKFKPAKRWIVSQKLAEAEKWKERTRERTVTLAGGVREERLDADADDDDDVVVVGLAASTSFASTVAAARVTIASSRRSRSLHATAPPRRRRPGIVSARILSSKRNNGIGSKFRSFFLLLCSCSSKPQLLVERRDQNRNSEFRNEKNDDRGLFRCSRPRDPAREARERSRIE